MTLLSHCDSLLRRALCGHHLPGNYRHFSSQRRVHGVVELGGVVKTPRSSNSLFFYRRSIFSTEGSFGKTCLESGRKARSQWPDPWGLTFPCVCLCLRPFVHLSAFRMFYTPCCGNLIRPLLHLFVCFRFF